MLNINKLNKEFESRVNVLIYFLWHLYDTKMAPHNLLLCSNKLFFYRFFNFIKNFIISTIYKS